MKIKYLKAGTGDCIIINHDKKNIIIDGGNESNYLLAEYSKIKENKERINFLIITHHDDDHIRGILDLFNEISVKNDELIIDNVIFNSPRKIFNKNIVENNDLSYKQANELEKYLSQYSNDLNWEYSLEENKLEKKINNLFKESDQIQFKIFSPKKETLEKYASNKGAYLPSDYRCEWCSNFSTLSKFIDDKSLDNTLSNKCSIVIMLNIQDKKCLFTGDITPRQLNEIIDDLKGDNQFITLEHIKLPHHGSYRSISSEILNKIQCSKFIISSNGKKHFLPNKRALLKIINSRKSQGVVKFYFNYGETIGRLNVSKIEERKYNFELIANNKNEGYAFDI